MSEAVAGSVAPWALSKSGSVLGGKYRLTQRLGDGAMGSVFAAIHERLGREVAVKILRPDLCSHRESAARFQREAELVTRLGHPSIVAVYDFGRAADGGLYFVMERILGRTLRARLDEGPLSDEEMVGVFAPLLSALQVAHAVGVVHRDRFPKRTSCRHQDASPRHRPRSNRADAHRRCFRL